MHQSFYRKNNRWTEGLISAAKAVANSTNLLIETADGVIGGRNSPEQLIVASNDVAASTAQLVAASRVKASFMSKTQERLEDASKAVTSACRSLVKQVQAIIDARANGEELVDYSKLSKHEFNRSYVFLIPLHRKYMANILFTGTWKSKSRFFSSRTHLAEHEKIWARCASSLTRKTRNECFLKKPLCCLACDTKLRSLLLYCNYIYLACLKFSISFHT
jgi:hypothetical protein